MVAEEVWGVGVGRGVGGAEEVGLNGVYSYIYNLIIISNIQKNNFSLQLLFFR